MYHMIANTFSIEMGILLEFVCKSWFERCFICRLTYLFVYVYSSILIEQLL